MNITSKPRLVSLEALLPSASGKSLATETKPVTAKNVAEYLPEPEIVMRAARALQSQGFIVSPSETTISITARPELFERIFSVTLEFRDLEQGSVQVILHKPHGIRIPESLKGLVEDIVAPEPPELFGNGTQNANER